MRRTPSALVPDALAAVTTIALTWPLWHTSGYGLSRDLVFTPRHPWNLDALGMGTAVPRAVPLDAVLALVTSVVDGQVAFRVLVAGVLLLAATGAHRMLSDLPVVARSVVAVAAVWNPYVVERLALGQWALLAAYAALWWLVPALRRAVAGERAGWLAVVGWVWLGSLTPSGGAMLVLVVLTTAGTALAGAGRRDRRILLLPVVALAGQLPWLLPSLLGASAALSDPAGVTAFAARAERSGGLGPTLLGTGGAWSPFVVPDSLTGWTGHLLAAAVLVALAVSARTIARRLPGLVAAAVVGLVLAGLASLPGGADLMGWAVAHVPGAGLLRDGQKWLLPYVVVVVTAAGTATASLAGALRRRDADLARLVPAVLVVVPVLLVPDAAGRTWQALEPVTYPAELADAVRVLDAAPASSGDVVTLPWSSYREFAWGNPLSAADPLPRWTRHRTVVSDTLPVPGGTVSGEDPRAREVGATLDGPALAGPLAAVGVGWVLVYADQPGAADLPTEGLRSEVSGPALTLYRVTGAEVAEPPNERRPAAVVVAVTDGAWLLAGLVAGLVAGLAAARPAGLDRRRHRSRETV